jgi:hypothetical protein
MGGVFSSPKPPTKSEEQLKAEKAQSAELDRLAAKEESQKMAMARRRRGRASLISGEETGVKTTLG